MDRRDFIKQGTGAALAASTLPGLIADTAGAASATAATAATIDFPGSDSWFHGQGWETLNPGYWQVKNHALRRRLENVGDRARTTGFPFHAATKGTAFETEYDPSLPVGIIYRREWKLTGEYTIEATFTYLADRPAPPADDDPDWKMHQDGYGMLGLACGAKSLFESYHRVRHAVQVAWSDDGQLQLIMPRGGGKKRGQPPRPRTVAAKRLQPGDRVTMRLHVQPQGDKASVTVELREQSTLLASLTAQLPRTATEGYVGVLGQGLIDFEVNRVNISPGDNQPLPAGEVDCYTCYPLGDTLRKVDENWQVRFVSLFASDGEQAEIRIAPTPAPQEGWEAVPVAGVGKIVNHQWRRNTAVIDAQLPLDPASATLYYTVWKDGVNVTSDPRVGSAGVGPGTGFVGDVPASGAYVGRLPRLQAPYKICGLSCHAITSGLQQETNTGLRILGGGDAWQFRDQPTTGAYQHFDDYRFQILCWEDDVWYMELVLYPPSTDDAYQIIKASICGPTSRWQMMRHWNVINPGDHDYGMDDVKGPEQLAIRRVPGLGQDTAYMRRNFQIVHHLITGDEQVDPLANPKKWRAWKMPQRDFTFVILDSRLWRSSQDVDIWDDAGWGAFQNLYDRTDPTRSLLGEEQFGWLQELLATDASPLICLTGINGLHTVWAGGKNGGPSDTHPKRFSQRDRVTADYAGWVKAGADRVLELLSGRQGVVTVYGDVHNGCIMKNVEQGVIECSFGPIGRSGGRAVIPMFGPQMEDVDGRDLEIHALYHKTHANPKLEPHAAGEPFYWNFLEMEFDPRTKDPKIGLRIRNMIDAPTQTPRGGGQLQTTASNTGRRPLSFLPDCQTLPNADVRFTTVNGRPIQATRSRADGTLPQIGFSELPPGESIIITAFDGQQTDSKIMTTRNAKEP